jgi:hypothetical protein
VPGPLSHASSPGTRYGAQVEIFFTSLLVAVALLITWFAFYVVYRLLHEDR